MPNEVVNQVDPQVHFLGVVRAEDQPLPTLQLVLHSLLQRLAPHRGPLSAQRLGGARSVGLVGASRHHAGVQGVVLESFFQVSFAAETLSERVSHLLSGATQICRNLLACLEPLHRLPQCMVAILVETTHLHTAVDIG